MPLETGSGLNVPLGRNLNGRERGSGLESGSEFDVRFVFLFST